MSRASRLPARRAAPDGLAEPVAEQGAVGEPGERVGERQGPVAVLLGLAAVRSRRTATNSCCRSRRVSPIETSTGKVLPSPRCASASRAAGDERPAGLQAGGDEAGAQDLRRAAAGARWSTLDAEQLGGVAVGEPDLAACVEGDDGVHHDVRPACAAAPRRRRRDHELRDSPSGPASGTTSRSTWLTTARRARAR